MGPQKSGAAPVSEAKIVLTAADQTKAAFASAIAGLGSVHSAVESVKGTLEALGVTLSAGYFADLIKSTIDANEKLQNLHVSTDLSVQDLAGLRLLAKETGTDLDGLAKGVNRMSVEIGKSPDKFKALGITATDAKGSLKQFADIFNLLPDIQQRNALAQAVFQKSWAEMAPTLAKGSAGIEDIMEKGARLSGVTAEMTAASSAFNDKIAELTGTGGFLNQQVATLLPLLNTLADDLIELQGKTSGADEGFHPLAETFRALIVVGGNVAYVLREVGREIGGIAAQAAVLDLKWTDGLLTVGVKVAKNWSQLSTIHEAMKADAAKDREEFDKWEAKIMSVGTALTVVGDTSDALSRKLQVQTRAEATAAAARAKAFLDAQNSAKEASTAYQEINKRVSERLATQGAEIAAGRELTDQEKFEAKILSDLLTVKKTLTAAERENIDAKLKASAVEANIIAVQKSELNDAKQRALERQRLVKDGYDQAKIVQDADDAAVHQSLVTAKEMLEQIQFDTAALTMDTQAREIATTKRELERQGIKEGTQAWTEYGEAIMAAAKQKATTADAVEEAKKAAEAWKKTNDEINRTLTDALMNAFESGTGFGKAFVKTVEDMFKQMVLRPIISAVMSPVSSAVNSAIGSTLGTSAVGGAAGSAGSGLFGSVTSAYAQGAAGLTVGNSIGVAGVGANFGIVDTAAVGLAGEGGAMAGVEAALGAIPVAGWVALGAMVLYSAFGNQGGGPKNIGSYSSNSTLYDGSSRTDTTAASDVAAKTTADSLIGAYGSAAKQLGITAGKLDAAVLFSIDDKGKGDAMTALAMQAYLNGKLVYDRNNALSGSDAYKDVGRTPEQLQAAETEAASRAVLAALEATDMPAKLKDYFAGMDPLKLSADQIQAAITVAANAQAMYSAFGKLGPAFSNMTDLAVTGMDSLITSLGGMAQASANLSDYYNNFYTDAEKRANTVSAIQKTLAAAGGAFSTDQIGGATRDQFRQTVEAYAARTDDAGKVLFAALMSVEGAFASITPAAKEAATAVTDTTAAIVDTTAAAADLAQAFKDQADALNAAVAALSSNTDAAYSSLERAVGAQKAAIQVTADLAQAQVTSLTGLFDMLKQQTAQLYGQIDGGSLAAAAGRQFIDQSLSAAQSTGYLPDQGQLQGAITAVTTSMQPGNYGSQFDMTRDQLVLAGKLSALQGISGKQLTAAEQQLQDAKDQIKALDDLLSSEKTQIDSLRGIDTRVLSVKDAIDALTAAILLEKAGAGGVLKTGATEQWVDGQFGKTWTSTGGAVGLQNQAGLQIYGNQSQFSGKAATDFVGANLAAGDPMAVYTRAIAEGISANSLDALMGWSSGTSNSWAQQNKLPSFDVGTNYVPRNMLALVHEGEAITPKRYNPAAGGGGDNRGVESRLDRLAQSHRETQRVMNQLLKLHRTWEGVGLPTTRAPGVVA
jgi:hypothetical protein